LFAAIGYLALVSTSRADHGQKLDEFLREGQLQKAHAYFVDVVQKSPDDHVARTAQGLVEFLSAVESLGQANFRYGVLSQHAAAIPLARLPVPLNPEPEIVSYAQVRQVIAEFQQGVLAAEKTLSEVQTGSIQIPLYLGRAKLDLNGDAVLADDETLWRIFAQINRGVEPDQGEEFYISVDGADVHWLRGYCHFLAAICDAVLAYDEQALFERCGQFLFPKIDSPFRVASDGGQGDVAMILDAVAAIHLARFPLEDPQRLASAHGHLLAMIQQSRQCWERANGEMDDDHEWIPNPNQTGVLAIRVPREMVDGWQLVLDELQAILEGKKLIPYWRLYQRDLFGNDEIPEAGTGINLKRVFLEPTDFDLVLTIQGSQVEPYLEEGLLSTPQSWEELVRVFRGQFFGFAIWFN
jgi:hypothetical protein